MGSALNEAEITDQLEQFHNVGMGGVEVSPIYGVPGTESRWTPFLSERWVELLAHTLREAERLDVGVDLIAGTGWPYGGPWVTAADAPRRLLWQATSAAAGEFMAEGGVLLATSTPDTSGSVLRLSTVLTGQQVKRAAPGGEGHVLDPLSGAAVRRYLGAFDSALSALGRNPGLRCVFNDSYEVFGANTTPGILAGFAARRGYDLRGEVRALHGDGDPDTVRRVRADYRETIGDLLREEFGEAWADWARSHGLKTRYQAHGSPGNPLDLYALSDIPETEIFGPARLREGGMAALRPAPPDFGEEEEALICKMASSAAHVAGKQLCSSESFTWLGEHGCVPLEHAKAEVDTLLTLGINHIFFHGTPSSPADADWPGWMFYASTHIAPTNPWWRDLPTLNAYIARCQSVLQAGGPDSDVLLYFPYHDLLAGEEGAKDDLQFLTVHRTGSWLRGNLPTFAGAARDLRAGGWDYDLVSDTQLIADISVENGQLAATGGARYRALVVVGCNRVPPDTLERIADLATAGARVLVVGDLPGDVPGLTTLPARRARAEAAREQLRDLPDRVTIGPNLPNLLILAHIPREPMADSGIEFIRRIGDDGSRTYFLANPGRADFRGGLPLAHGGADVTILDPLNGKTAAGKAHVGPSGQTHVALSLPAGGSTILIFPPAPETPAGPPSASAGRPLDLSPSSGPIRETSQILSGPWQVDFLEGGPTLPASRTLETLSDWTTWPDADELRAFSGTARYRITFDASVDTDDPPWLDLGVVCHSARVLVNGQNVGTLIARPWRLALDIPLLPSGNVLEIEVTNLMANRLADLERRVGDQWRPFLFVGIHYQAFDAAEWEPLPSGLIGPVRFCLTRVE